MPLTQKSLSARTAAWGAFEQVVTASLAGALLPVVVVNPRRARDFARACGQLAKTDTLDAALIALFAERVRPQLRPLPDEATRHLGDLAARRRQVIKMTTAERHRLRQAELLTSVPGVGPTVARTLLAELPELG